LSVNQQDTLELNASSGTPAMKGAWSLLQAAGYAPRSHVWQIRNPKEQDKNQSRVFSSDVQFLKQEFDLKVIKQQVADYNYSGALSTLKTCGLETDLLTALLTYGRCRMSFDFDKAEKALEPVKHDVDEQLIREISELQKRSLAALSRECYLNAITKLKNREYAEFLTLVASFQENTLRAMIWQKTSIDLRDSNHWSEFQKIDNGKLYKYLKTSYKNRLPNFMDGPAMMKTLEYYSDFSNVRTMFKELKQYIKARNNQIHRLEGTSEIQEQAKLLKTLRELLGKISTIPEENSFNILNKQIFELLNRAIS
jgi:CRISPR-associated protein (Cas_Csm6)